jgi:hypothetical protein
MALADRQIQLNQRLRESTDAAVRRIWGSLPDYNRPSLDRWLSQVLPVVLGAQRQQVAVTQAYLSAALDRPAASIDPEAVIGSAARAGTPPEEVYTRPFIQVWQALATGRPYVEAVNVGLARATSSAAMDVQLAMRDTLKAVGDTDPSIAGYQRVADPGACEYCLLLDGAQFRTDDPMPIHNFCGCGVEPVVYTRGFDNRNNLAKFNADKTSIPDGVKVNDHGELGPVLGDPDQHFTKL